MTQRRSRTRKTIDRGNRPNLAVAMPRAVMRWSDGRLARPVAAKWPGGGARLSISKVAAWGRHPVYTRILRGTTRLACETRSYENRERGGNARDRSRHLGTFRSPLHHLDGERRLGRRPCRPI